MAEEAHQPLDTPSKNGLGPHSTAFYHDDWDTSRQNARNWSPARKALTTALVSAIGFTCTVGSSIWASGRDQVAAQFHVSTIVSVLPIVSYNAGMGLGPLIASPLSETFGRRAVYLIVLPLFCLFILGTGFADSMAAIIVCRFFAGMFASPSVAIAAATIADLYAMRERATPLIIYYNTPMIGAYFGPFIGNFVVSSKSWRWTSWTTLFFAAAIFWPILFARESYKKTILERQHRKSSVRPIEGFQPPESITARVKMFVRKNLGRPLHMLFTEPVVTFCCMYMAFQFGLLYVFILALPYVFSTAYNFDIQAQGLVFLGPVCGCILACLFLLFVERKIYQPRLKAFALHSDPTTYPPEHRLYAAFPASVILPTGLFIFAWTARPEVHFIVPVLATVLVGMGSMTVYCPAGLYLIETYGALYSASASGASSLLRYTLATVFPLFALRMYEKLGIGWATSLLGFVTIFLAPIPWVFWRYGEELRRRSRYQQGD